MQVMQEKNMSAARKLNSYAEPKLSLPRHYQTLFRLAGYTSLNDILDDAAAHFPGMRVSQAIDALFGLKKQEVDEQDAEDSLQFDQENPALLQSILSGT